MAFMNQERKKKLAAELKKAMAGYDIKYTLRVHHYSTIIMTISEGSIDFLKNANDVLKEKLPAEQYALRGNRVEKYLQVNTYWINEHFTGIAAGLLSAAKAALSTGNHDRSDVQSDYFDVGWYVNINVGQWDKPYKLTK
jgi:hypothetical protein